MTTSKESTLAALIRFDRGFMAPVCGIDEAGRGPLAGPVVAGAVIFPDIPAQDWPAALQWLNDSKKLTARRREEIFKALQGFARIGIGQASAEEIDRLNILEATFLAMGRAYHSLNLSGHGQILIDGNRMPSWCADKLTKTVIKGDSQSASIAAASVVAKVTRDRIMTALARDYPEYGWERNQGYPSQGHRDAIATHGTSPHHRLSFRGVSEYAETGPRAADVDNFKIKATQ